jgi:hypothetical protein
MLAAALLLSTGAAQAVNIFVNGGYETAGAGTLAANWVPAASGYDQLCGASIAHTGNCVADITSPALSAGITLQNNVLDGGQPGSLLGGEVGNTLTFSFWTYGWAGTTGAANYALRYLDSVGNILAQTPVTNFNSSLSPTKQNPGDTQPATWNQVSTTLTVPTGAFAAFVEFSHGMGPVGPLFPDCGVGHPNGLCFMPGLVYIDDVSLETSAVPVPAAVWLFGSGLLGLVGVARRSKKA